MSEALASYLRAAIPDIVASFERRLVKQDSPLFRSDDSREQIVAHARHLLDDLLAELDGEHQETARRTLASDIGATRAAQGFHPGDSVRAAGILFDVLLRTIGAHLGDRPDRSELTLLVALTMNTVLVRALGQAADAYGGFLLNRLHSAHVEERRRISREVHDRIGFGVTVAYRNLELFNLHRERQPVRAAARVGVAYEALRETLDAVRDVISNLRVDEPLDGLEKEIERFLDSVQRPELEAHIEVNGDEHWAPPQVRNELLLILREAVRNVVAHARAGQLLVRVDVTPDELRSIVRDDGLGFDPRGVPRSRAGIASMRERAALLDGTLTITSAPGRGTLVELLVPLGEA
ncbi:ATP-binding protein [Micromonospora sp. NPDC050980]|uniref:sensor histidine kinase n=1 Tax=Micromonospora sp. NPDC050980 TaxID=3155161 RepID=UPI00340CCAD2